MIACMRRSQAENLSLPGFNTTEARARFMKKNARGGYKKSYLHRSRTFVAYSLSEGNEKIRERRK